MLSYVSVRGTGWAIGIHGLIFPLCRRTPFKLRCEESMNKRHSDAMCICQVCEESNNIITITERTIYFKECCQLKISTTVVIY